MADEATDATEADWANKADMVAVSKANETDKANKAIATDVTNANNNQLGRADKIAGVANTADETK